MLNVTIGSGERQMLAKEESVMPREFLYFFLKGKSSDMSWGGMVVLVRTTTEEGRVRIMDRREVESGSSGSGSSLTSSVDEVSTSSVLDELAGRDEVAGGSGG
jgi:hypothetical protein